MPIIVVVKADVTFIYPQISDQTRGGKMNVRILVNFSAYWIFSSRCISRSLDCHQPQPPSLGKERHNPLPPLPPLCTGLQVHVRPGKESDTNNLWGVDTKPFSGSPPIVINLNLFVGPWHSGQMQIYQTKMPPK